MEGTSQGGEGGFQFIKLDGLAKVIGASDAGLRFLIALLIGYPLAFIYHFLLAKKSACFKNAYFTVCGLLILYFCFAQDIVYCLVSILVTYIVLTLIGGTVASVTILFAFNLAYLVLAYVFTASDSYDIKWTTPQCILCLRLIGLAWDVYDGKRPKEHLSLDQKVTALDRIPTLMEITGFSLFFGAQMAGPQFPMKRYLDFIEDRLVDNEAEAKGGSRFLAALKRFLLGLIFLALFTTFDVYYRSDYIITEEFVNAPGWKKCIDLVCWYHVLFCKYIFVWLFAESCCITTGLSYNGVDEHGIAKWDSLKNIQLSKYFSGHTFQSLVVCFNVNTNQWVARYIFKRLKFLGNRHISHITTLAFLAIWHGFYVGYFVVFATEFLVVQVERQMQARAYQLTGMSLQELSWPIRLPIIAFLYVVKQVGFGFCVVSFALLRWRRIKVVYGSMYWLGYIICIVLLIANFIIGKMMKKPKKDEKQG
eukprot:gene15000-16549_t